MMKRIKAAAARVKTEVDAAQKHGGMKWFNMAYSDYRARRGRMNFPQPRQRLYRELVKRQALHGRFDLNSSVLGEVFGSIG
jgi:hypothetical protein